MSDGIIAPGYSAEALEVLKKKKGGNYCVLQIDPTFEPALIERKVLFGLTLEQRRNDAVIDKNLFTNIVSKKKDVCCFMFKKKDFTMPIQNPLSCQREPCVI